VGAENSVTSCDLHVLVNETAESISSQSSVEPLVRRDLRIGAGDVGCRHGDDDAGGVGSPGRGNSPSRALPRPSALWHGRVMSAASLAELLVEYDRARAYTRDLWSDLSEGEVRWRPHANSSAIGWHLGHQPAIAHFMLRNLTAAEASLDAELEALMDAATGEPDRGDLPTLDRIVDYRAAVAERVHFRVSAIDDGAVGPRPATGRGQDAAGGAGQPRVPARQVDRRGAQRGARPRPAARADLAVPHRARRLSHPRPRLTCSGPS
jgi:hypothetical protein